MGSSPEELQCKCYCGRRQEYICCYWEQWNLSLYWWRRELVSSQQRSSNIHWFTLLSSSFINRVVWQICLCWGSIRKRRNVVYRSTNNGTSWSVCDSGISNSSIYALATSGTDIFAGTDSGTFRSTNYGATWTQVGYNPRVINFGVSGSNLFEGTANGAYLTTNNGVSWSSLNSGLPTPKTIVSLAISGWISLLMLMVGIIIPRIMVQAGLTQILDSMIYTR